MKTMQQMQSEIISKARWDGGYPKAMHMGLGVIALARDEQHERELRKQGAASARFMAAGYLVMLVFLFGWIVWVVV
jgi:hypothetical protein